MHAAPALFNVPLVPKKPSRRDFRPNATIDTPLFAPGASPSRVVDRRNAATSQGHRCSNRKFGVEGSRLFIKSQSSLIPVSCRLFRYTSALHLVGPDLEPLELSIPARCCPPSTTFTLTLLASPASAVSWYFLVYYPAPGAHFTAFSGSMMVPGIPGAATYYLWPGLQPADGSGVYQNVLDGTRRTWWPRQWLVLQRPVAGLGRGLPHVRGRGGHLQQREDRRGLDHDDGSWVYGHDAREHVCAER